MNVQKVMWALGELSLEYRRKDVGGSFGYPDDYLGVNPNHLVPTIRDGDLTLWESNACVRYLARRYGQGSLWPDNVASLAQAEQWMDWQTSTLGPVFLQIFFNKVRRPPEQADQAQIDAGVQSCGRLYQLLDKHLADRLYVAGEALTMGDVSLGAMTYRYMTLDIDRPAIAHVDAWYQRLCDRAPYRKHVMIPFGRNAAEWLEEEQRNAGVQ